MLRGKEKIIYEKFIPPFSKNGRSCKSRDEIFIRGRGCNTSGVSLAQFNLHNMSMSIKHSYMSIYT